MGKTCQRPATRSLSGTFTGLESAGLVAAVAKRQVLAGAASAQSDCRFRLIDGELIALRIEQPKITFHQQRSVVSYANSYVGHEFLLFYAVLSIQSLQSIEVAPATVNRGRSGPRSAERKRALVQMRIVLITPAPPRSRAGNRVTALRWARLFRELGHRVDLDQNYHGQTCDLLVALHARRSAGSVARYRHRHPTGRLIVAMTGTDLYRDLPRSRRAARSLDQADAIVVLQSEALKSLQPNWRRKARVVYQSAQPPDISASPLKRVFEIVVIGHLRSVKDPFRAAMAARRLPPSSRIRISHLGAALSSSMKTRAEREMAINPRYRWLGDRPRRQVWRYLLRSRALVVSSTMEGGANVIAEAAVGGIPVIGSRVSGNVGMLGADYPGYFALRDTSQLARLLLQLETDNAFYSRLQTCVRKLKERFSPARERTAWQQLIESL